MRLRLRTASTNTFILSDLDASIVDLEQCICTFTLSAIEANKINESQYYRAQLAFVNNDAETGYYSTVGIIKCVAQPTVTIGTNDDFDPGQTNFVTTTLVGKYVQDTSYGDSTEKVYSYNFKIWDSKNELIIDSGEQIHDVTADVSSSSSEDIFEIHKELITGEVYKTQYTVTTLNGLIVQSNKYKIMKALSVDIIYPILLHANVDFDNGYIALQLQGEMIPEYAMTYKAVNFFDTYDSEETYYQKTAFGTYIEYEITEEEWDSRDQLYVEDGEKAVTYHESSYNGTFVITRADNQDDYFEWEVIKRFNLNGQVLSDCVFYDKTVQQGITYKYALQQYNKQYVSSNKIYLTYSQKDYEEGLCEFKDIGEERTIKADFEDMFLYDGKRQLKVRFNPKVSSFKTTIPEQKIETIGSKYPFIFRNGQVSYKEFPIEGLISFQSDEDMLFLQDDEWDHSGILDYDYYRIATNHDKYNGYRDGQEYLDLDSIDAATLKDLIDYKRVVPIRDMKTNQIVGYRKVFPYQLENLPLTSNYQTDGTKENVPSIIRANRDLTTENLMSERFFKLKVLDWLNDGKVKLFRSPGEGNYLVRILNVSLRPEDALGRMLHNFTCQAYEIAELTYDNMLAYGIVSEDIVNVYEDHWGSNDVNAIINDPTNKPDSDGFYDVSAENITIKKLEISDFAPGDQIRLTYLNGETNIYTIGVTGTLNFEDEDRPIMGIGIKPNPDVLPYDDFSRSIIFSYVGMQLTEFDMISQVQMTTQMAEQYIGPKFNLLDPYDLRSNAYGIQDKETGLTPTVLKMDESKDNIYNSLIQRDNISYQIRDTADKFTLVNVDILSVHKRELIPIFAYNTRAELVSEDIDEDTLRFSVTPFGQGYVNSENIINFYYVNGNKVEINYQNPILTLEPRVDYGGVNINDLYEVYKDTVLISPLSIYKIFVLNDEEKWEPLDEGKYQYYDVYTSSWWDTDDPQYLYYNPSFSINDLDIKNSVEIGQKYVPFEDNEVEERDENITYYYDNNNIWLTNDSMTIYNLGHINKLTLGNGVYAEVTFQLRYVDYVIEDQDDVYYDYNQYHGNGENDGRLRIKDIKDIYLNESKNFIEDLNANRLEYEKIVNIDSDLEEKRTQAAILQGQYENYDANVKNRIDSVLSIAEERAIEQKQRVYTDRIKKFNNLLTILQNIMTPDTNEDSSDDKKIIESIVYQNKPANNEQLPVTFDENRQLILYNKLTEENSDEFKKLIDEFLWVGNSDYFDNEIEKLQAKIDANNKQIIAIRSLMGKISGNYDSYVDPTQIDVNAVTTTSLKIEIKAIETEIDNLTKEYENTIQKYIESIDLIEFLEYPTDKEQIPYLTDNYLIQTAEVLKQAINDYIELLNNKVKALNKDRKQVLKQALEEINDDRIIVQVPSYVTIIKDEGSAPILQCLGEPEAYADGDEEVYITESDGSIKFDEPEESIVGSVDTVSFIALSREEYNSMLQELDSNIKLNVILSTVPTIIPIGWTERYENAITPSEVEALKKFYPDLYNAIAKDYGTVINETRATLTSYTNYLALLNSLFNNITIKDGKQYFNIRTYLDTLSSAEKFKLSDSSAQQLIDIKFQLLSALNNFNNNEQVSFFFDENSIVNNEFIYYLIDKYNASDAQRVLSYLNKFNVQKWHFVKVTKSDQSILTADDIKKYYIIKGKYYQKATSNNFIQVNDTTTYKFDPNVTYYEVEVIEEAEPEKSLYINEDEFTEEGKALVFEIIDDIRQYNLLQSKIVKGSPTSYNVEYETDYTASSTYQKASNNKTKAEDNFIQAKAAVTEAENKYNAKVEACKAMKTKYSNATGTKKTTYKKKYNKLVKQKKQLYAKLQQAKEAQIIAEKQLNLADERLKQAKYITENSPEFEKVNITSAVDSGQSIDNLVEQAREIQAKIYDNYTTLTKFSSKVKETISQELAVEKNSEIGSYLNSLQYLNTQKATLQEKYDKLDKQLKDYTAAIDAYDTDNDELQIAIDNYTQEKTDNEEIENSTKDGQAVIERILNTPIIKDNVTRLSEYLLKLRSFYAQQQNSISIIPDRIKDGKDYADYMRELIEAYEHEAFEFLHFQDAIVQDLDEGLASAGLDNILDDSYQNANINIYKKILYIGLDLVAQLFNDNEELLNILNNIAQTNINESLDSSLEDQTYSSSGLEKDYNDFYGTTAILKLEGYQQVDTSQPRDTEKTYYIKIVPTDETESEYQEVIFDTPEAGFEPDVEYYEGIYKYDTTFKRSIIYELCKDLIKDRFLLHSDSQSLSNNITWDVSKTSINTEALQNSITLGVIHSGTSYYLVEVNSDTQNKSSIFTQKPEYIWIGTEAQPQLTTWDWVRKNQLNGIKYISISGNDLNYRSDLTYYLKVEQEDKTINYYRLINYTEAEDNKGYFICAQTNERVYWYKLNDTGELTEDVNTDIAVLLIDSDIVTEDFQPYNFLYDNIQYHSNLDVPSNISYTYSENGILQPPSDLQNLIISNNNNNIEVTAYKTDWHNLTGSIIYDSKTELDENNNATTTAVNSLTALQILEIDYRYNIINNLITKSIRDRIYASMVNEYNQYLADSAVAANYQKKADDWKKKYEDCQAILLNWQANAEKQQEKPDEIKQLEIMYSTAYLNYMRFNNQAIEAQEEIDKNYSTLLATKTKIDTLGEAFEQQKKDSITLLSNNYTDYKNKILHYTDLLYNPTSAGTKMLFKVSDELKQANDFNVNYNYGLAYALLRLRYYMQPANSTIKLNFAELRKKFQDILDLLEKNAFIDTPMYIGDNSLKDELTKDYPEFLSYIEYNDDIKDDETYYVISNGLYEPTRMPELDRENDIQLWVLNPNSILSLSNIVSNLSNNSQYLNGIKQIYLDTVSLYNDLKIQSSENDTGKTELYNQWQLLLLEIQDLENYQATHQAQDINEQERINQILYALTDYLYYLTRAYIEQVEKRFGVV